MKIDKLTFYTDGAYSSATTYGGWGFYCPELLLRVGNSESNTTNNRMEIMAYLKVLEFIKDFPHEVDKIEIMSDSQYLLGIKMFNWKKTVNFDLWDQINSLEKECSSIITFFKVKGHTDNTGNIIADKIASSFSQLKIK